MKTSKKNLTTTIIHKNVFIEHIYIIYCKQLRNLKIYILSTQKRVRKHIYTIYITYVQKWKMIKNYKYKYKTKYITVIETFCDQLTSRDKYKDK